MNNLLVNAVVHTGQFTSLTLPSGVIWSALITAVVVVIAFYVLRSIGLFVLAKNQKINKAFLAFIPGVWIYLACKIIGKTRFFGKPYEQIAIWLCIIFTISEVLTLAYNVLVYLPLFEYVFVLDKTLHVAEGSGVSTSLKSYLGMGIYVDSGFIPYGNSWVVIRKILVILDYITPIFDILSIFITVSVYFALFRKFWPQHYMLASLLSIFVGLFPVFVFVIRNKKPIDYNAYLRSRYGGYYNRYSGGYGNPYSNPYQQPTQPRQPESPFGDFENGSSSSNANGRPSEPFGEFTGSKEKKKEEPFSEFNNNDKN